MKPIGYYASAPSSTTDATILAEFEQRYGSELENLTPAQKSAWLIALMAEAIEPEGVEVDYCIDCIPNLNHLWKLSYGAKLCLCNALINQLLLCGSH